MTDRVARILGLLVLALAVSACMPGRERLQHREPRETRSAHRIDLETGEGETVAIIRLQSRSATISDSLGVRIGRAAAVQDRVVVRDRMGQPRLVLRPASAEAERSVADHVALLEDGAGRTVGRLTVTGDDVRLYGAEGFQRGETACTGDSEGAVEADVFGAEGTDVLVRVRSTASREITVLDPWDRVRARLTGYAIPVWIAAALTLEEPDLPSSAAEDAGGPDRADEDERLFQVGVLLYLQRL